MTMCLLSNIAGSHVPFMLDSPEKDIATIAYRASSLQAIRQDVPLHLLRVLNPVGMGLASIRPESRMVGKRMEASPIPTEEIHNKSVSYTHLRAHETRHDL